MKAKLTREVKAAMEDAGMSELGIRRVEAALTKKKAPKMSMAMKRRVEEVRYAEGYAVVTAKSVFTPEGWKARMSGGTGGDADRSAEEAREARTQGRTDKADLKG